MFNALTADLATGLSTAITKNGQTTPTANIPMAGFKFTGLGAGSGAGESLRYEQVTLDTKTTVASATTPNIWTSTGRLIDYTGTATATGFAAAPQAGASRTLVCAGASVFTAGANMIIPGTVSGSNFTAAANTRIDVTALTTTQFLLNVVKADGTPITYPPLASGVATTFLGADVNLSNTGSWFSGPNTGSIGAAGQTWLIIATGTLIDTAGAARLEARIFDGTTGKPEAGAVSTSLNNEVTVTVHLVVTLSAATTFTLQARDSSSTSGKLLTSVTSAATANVSSFITAVRLA